MTKCTLSQMDAFEWLASLENESVDLICTDPPYESMEKHRAQGTTTRLKKSKASSNEWFDIMPNAQLPALVSELYRVLRIDRHAYIFCDDDTSDIVKSLALEVGFTRAKRLVWNKLAIGMGYTYRAKYEFVLFLQKRRKSGKHRKLKNLGIPDVLDYKRLKGPNCYPTEKPVELMEMFVSQSVEPGELVIDPFYGAGPVALAAIRHGCDFAGTDTSERAYEVASSRVREELDPLQKKLFA